MAWEEPLFTLAGTSGIYQDRDSLETVNATPWLWHFNNERPTMGTWRDHPSAEVGHGNQRSTLPLLKMGGYPFTLITEV